MKITFLSLDDQNNKVYFISEAVKNGQELIFLDKTIPNTTIDIEILKDLISFNRSGEVNSKMIFKLNKKTKGSYENSMGLAFDFEVICTKLEYNSKKIRIDYTLILDEYTKTKHKLSLLLEETLAK